MQHAAAVISRALARGIKPRAPLSVSDWSDANRWLSRKESPFPGAWRTSRNEALREPMDALSARSTAHKVVLRFPIQFGKTAMAQSFLGYTMDHDPAPIMVCLPGEVSLQKWVDQKLNPMIEETAAVRQALASTASRDSANRATFKDFRGGQLYLEHAGSPARLKSSTVRKLVVDELDEFAASLRSGDDPMALLTGRTSAYPSNHQILLISTPTIAGFSRIDTEYEDSDQRRYHVRCPDCGHRQALEWAGLHWDDECTRAWYACQECGVAIDENEKPRLLATGQWTPAFPARKVRGYTINALYYPLGMGPRWADLAREWKASQGDHARLKTFINDRLAETWEDPAMRAVKHQVIRDRAEPYPMRHAPAGVLACTAGVDTQDNRLAVHITGWGPTLEAWTLDYVELMGDPAQDEVWVALTELLNRPIEHALGGVIRPEAVAIDAGGHRTEDVYNYVRSRMVRRPMAIFGAKPNNAPILSRGKYADVNWRGKLDKRGVMIHHVGTVRVKHWLYSRLSSDADIDDRTKRKIHVSDGLPEEYFAGLVSEQYDPRKNRFVKKPGPRNEPLDVWVYAFAAAHHPELRLHRLRRVDWDARRQRLTRVDGQADAPEAEKTESKPTRRRHPKRRKNWTTQW